MKSTLPADTARVQIADVPLERRAQMGRIALALEDERILAFTLLTPALILIMVFIAYPFCLGIWMSLTDKLVGTPGKFIGLGNYVRLLQSDIFRTAAWNTVFFTTMATVFKAALGMWLAVLLNRKFRLARLTRSTVLLPFIVPTVLSTLAWLWMFDATFSVFNWVLRALWQMQIGLFGIVLKHNWGYFHGPLWLGDPGWAMGSVIAVNVWRGLPFFAISFLAALQTIPQELYEAAFVEGASHLRILWSIVVPLVVPALLTLGIINALWAWNELLIAVVMLQREESRTLQAGLALLKGKNTMDIPLVMAGATISAIPLLLLYLFGQRVFMSGLLAGAVKE